MVASLMANRIGLDVAMDLELLEIWETLLSHPVTENLSADDLEFIGLLLRVSWAKGAQDALEDPDRIRQIARTYGYKLS
jgi:hypothetical protein